MRYYDLYVTYKQKDGTKSGFIPSWFMPIHGHNYKQVRRMGKTYIGLYNCSGWKNVFDDFDCKPISFKIKKYEWRGHKRSEILNKPMNKGYKVK